MGSSRIDKVEKVFHRLVALPPEAREAELQKLAADDAELVDTVRRLLRASVEPTRLDAGIGSLSDEIEASFEELPAQLGPYRIVRVLGEGGWGRVYEAEQTEPITRRLAIKVLHPGLNSRQVLRRFRREMEILGRLDHPGIVAIHDAGMTPQGLPYFVMDYVPGEPIDRFCRETTPSLDTRLSLLEQVCEAVQHAHNRGVMHRDLKPSNILVTRTDQGLRAFVIDFGIAKATEADGATMTLATGSHSVGTPEFMSPEQSGGDHRSEADSRTDVFTLGLVLYTLLAGTHPERTSPSDAVRPPATSGFAGGRRLRELGWIISRCTERMPERRYQAVSELAADIRRFRRSEPLEAGPRSAWYGVRSWARRQPLVAALVLITTVAVLGGGGLAVSGRLAAESAQRAAAARAEEADEVAAYLGEVLAGLDLREASGGQREALVALVDRGLEQVESGSLTAGAELRLRGTLARAFTRLREHPRALVAWNNAVALSEREYGPRSREALDARNEQWRAAVEVSDLSIILGSASAHLPRVASVFGERADQSVDARRMHALALERRSDFGEGRRRYESLISDCTAWFGQNDSRTLSARAGLCSLVSHQSTKAAEAGDAARAEELAAQAYAMQLELYDRYRQSQPDNDFARTLARLNLAEMESKRGQHSWAADEMRTVINIWRVDRGHDDKYTVWAFRMLAEARLREGRPGIAEAVWREALNMMLARRERGRSTDQLPDIVSHLSKLLAAQGDSAGAESIRGVLESE